MDDDRKYRQHGYMDGPDRGDRPGQDRRPSGPRPPLDVTGPRLPRMVQTVVAARCYNCATTLPSGSDFGGQCPKCSVALHCCKQCAHFEPSQRLQCTKPIKQRVSPKDKENDCEYFDTRVTVARDASRGESAQVAASPGPRSARNARAAFDNLFKK